MNSCFQETIRKNIIWSVEIWSMKYCLEIPSAHSRKSYRPAVRNIISKLAVEDAKNSYGKKC